MTTVTSRLFDALDNFAAALALRSGLSGVQIATGPLGGESARESIQFFTGRDNQDHVTTGRRRESTFSLDGAVWVLKPGKNETVIKAARDRAQALLAEIEDELRTDPSIGGTVRESGITDYDLDQGVNPDGHWCQLDFTISGTVRLNS